MYAAFGILTYMYATFDLQDKTASTDIMNYKEIKYIVFIKSITFI